MAEAEPVATSTEITPMAEVEAPPSAATETESPPVVEDPAPSKESDAPREEVLAAAEVPVAEAEACAAAAPDNKRKLEDLEKPSEEAMEEKQDAVVQEPAAATAPDGSGLDGVIETADDPAAKRQCLDEETGGSDQVVKNIEELPVGNGQHSSLGNSQHTSADNLDTGNTSAPLEGSFASEEHQQLQPELSSQKFEVPNNKVGVLIGKAGETIRILQQSSGAKIQITRDAETDPTSSTRPVELIGTAESIHKAEQLIKDVIKEAEAGGSPALVARGFGNAQSGSEQQEIQVPIEKIGMIIGKGGETIKNLQTQTGARIQLNPQHLPDGDTSRERTVRITGNKRQIEYAKQMINEVMSRVPVRSSHLSGGYSQYRPRGPSSLNQWGSRAPPSSLQPAGYDYQQRSTYPPQSTQYPSQPYGSYPQQHPPRSSINTGWDQRGPAPVQTGGFDYYGQGGQSVDTRSANPVPAQSPAPGHYNYGHSQAASYGQPTSYTQSINPQHRYSHGYNEQKYDNQAPGNQSYGQQLMSSQPGAYAQQAGTPQAEFAQQTYNKPAYGSAQQSYGPPKAGQGDPVYQGATPTPYVAGGASQQSYPYGQSMQSQQTSAYNQAYGPTTGISDVYAHPLPAAGYPQQSTTIASGYGQGGQLAPGYNQQAPQSAGYGQYPPSQPSYGDQPSANNVNYGYQGGPADAGYGVNSVPASGYAAAPAGNQAAYGQAGYAQPQSFPTGY